MSKFFFVSEPVVPCIEERKKVIPNMEYLNSPFIFNFFGAFEYSLVVILIEVKFSVQIHFQLCSDCTFLPKNILWESKQLRKIFIDTKCVK